VVIDVYKVSNRLVKFRTDLHIKYSLLVDNYKNCNDSKLEVCPTDNVYGVRRVNINNAFFTKINYSPVVIGTDV